VGGTSNWNTGSNWDLGVPPEAFYEETATINNGGTATLSTTATNSQPYDPGTGVVPGAVGGLVLGQNVGDSGTLRVMSGGVINLVDSTGAAAGVANIGLNGTGVLEVQGGGKFGTTSLDVNTGSQVIIGGGTGAATVTSTGNSWLGGTTTVRGPGHTFSVTGDVLLEGSGIYNPVISAGTHTPLRVTGSASLGGSLKVEFGPGYTPAVGNSWNLVDATAVTGSFANAANGIVDVEGANAAAVGSAYRVRTVSGGTNGSLLQLSLEGLLVLRVNRDTGALAIVNPFGASVPSLDGYTITSGVGSLQASYKGISGAPAGDTGWEKAPMNSTTGLAEFKPTGGLNVSSAATNLSLGTGFNKTAVASQGLGVDGEDLAFSYHTLGGSVVVGQVEYVGTKFLNDIALIVNTTTGVATLKNDTLLPIAIDGYSIVSSTSALSTVSWTGIGASVANWNKSPASSSSALTESNPNAATSIDAGGSFNLGTIGNFSSEAAQDGLAMKFLIGSEQSFRYATIQFISGASQPGDFDGDGDVDGRDLLRWQRGQSPNPLSASDLAAWKANYGAGSLAAVAAVPEPGTWMLALMGSAVVFARRRRSNSTENGKEQLMKNHLVAVVALFVVVAGWTTKAQAAGQLTFSPTQPAVGTYDQSQLLDDAIIPGGTAPGGGAYNSQAFTDNAGPPGQTFTAPPTKHLYGLTAISVKGAGDAGGGAIDTATWSIEISKVNGTNLTALKTITGITLPAGGVTTDWVTIALSGFDVPTLDPNSQYAFEIYSSTGWFGIDATQTDTAYAGGTAFNSAGPGRAFTGNTLGNLAIHGYDRTFIAQLTPPPGGPGDATGNGVVDVNDYNLINANFEKTVAMFTNGDLDGNSFVDLNDFARWRDVAPLSALIAAGIAVPEPSTAVLFTVVCFGLMSRRRHGLSQGRQANQESSVVISESPIKRESRMKVALPSLLAVIGLCLAASTSQATVTMTIGATAPTPGTYDQYTLLDDAAIPGGTTPGGGTFNSQAFSDNNGPPGQIFTTPASSSPSLPAYRLNTIWLKGAEASGGNFGNFTTSTTWGIRISEVNGAVLTPVKTITGIASATGITGGDWMTWTFTAGDLQTLQANKQYAFDLYSSEGWLGFDADTTDSYAGGTAFNSGGGGARNFNGVTTGNLANHVYDRTFLVGLSPSLLIGPGDVDGDGDTDLADYGIIKTNFFLATGATRGQGDLTGDGKVLLDDFAIWKNNAAGSLVAQISVPEPTGIVLMAAAGVLGCLRRTRRHGVSAR
jgi:hypothetical protein